MSVVNVKDIKVLSRQNRFSDPYAFRITFDCIVPLEDDLEWRLVYVGSAKNSQLDQELDNCCVGPVPLGINTFEFEAEPPKASDIPADELVGVTVVLLSCAYHDQDFIHVGYYVNTEYDDPALQEQFLASQEEGAEEKGIVPPDPHKHVDRLVRTVLDTKPRVTRHNINWNIDVSRIENSALAAQIAEASRLEPTAEEQQANADADQRDDQILADGDDDDEDDEGDEEADDNDANEEADDNGGDEEADANNNKAAAAPAA